ncbi:hypothetical protein LTR48_003290 [Friedmanniomyces endolithicus]|uniref:Fungal-type protein kinase domain-containing protein n=1 Tax=Rachicladosporium monterosium TaxID=1507873 RepID=A0ABR0L8L0_9PEZI|nr:hypothetical protein LTR48_003290 [Friedmanniomyces endolithicus]KAK5145155.1 hypothetical protein LTR32_003049 [Rachicladosporium monterosium]
MQRHQTAKHVWQNPSTHGGARQGKSRKPSMIVAGPSRTSASEPSPAQHVRRPQHLAGFSRQELRRLIRAGIGEDDDRFEQARDSSDSDSDEDEAKKQSEAIPQRADGEDHPQVQRALGEDITVSVAKCKRLAILGMDTQTGGWMEAQNYTPILAAMITVLRAMVVYRSWQARQQPVRGYVKAGRSDREATAEAPSVYEGVQQMVDRVMTLTQFHGHPTPLDRIYHHKTYGMKIRYTTQGEGRVSWIGERMLINNISFSMDEIRTVVHGLNDTVQQRLVRDLLWMTPGESADTWKPPGMPAFELAMLFDNHAEMSEGWSFIQDRRHSWAVDGAEWMWQRIFDHESIQKRLITSSIEEVQAGNIQCRDVGIERYFRQVRRFKEELMVLVHMSAGAPARATELISIQHENGPQAQSQRGVFIDNGMVVFITGYHKG